MPELELTTPGIEKLLKNINTSKSIGPDISNVILKNCAKQLAPGITTIFQTSADAETLPDDWVNANVSPIYI